MSTAKWIFLFVGLMFLAGIAADVSADGQFTTTWGAIKKGERGVNAAPSVRAIEAKPVRGIPVGRGLNLWVFVHPEKGGKGGKPPKDGPSPYCDDGNQSDLVPQFANANPYGLTFNINVGSIPINRTAAIGAIHASFEAWDNVSTTATYFKVNDSGGASGPADDKINTVGWVRLVPRSVLAATWVWTDASGTIVEADIFNNAFRKWGVFTTCDAQGKFEVGSIDTHEVGHVVGLNHLSDPNSYATMYPSGPKGEVRKRTLTAGDANSYLAAGGK